jgi:hypothetical protein
LNAGLLKINESSSFTNCISAINGGAIYATISGAGKLLIED